MVIGTLFKNFGMLLLVVALVVAFLKHRRPGNEESLAAHLWTQVLFYAVGFGFLWAGVFHGFFQEIAATSIGWSPSPFEWELAWAEFGVAAMALWSPWRSNDFRLPVTVIYAVFSLGAAYQHINQIRCCANFAPGNAGPILWIGDIALPLFLLVVAYLTMSRSAVRQS